MPWKEERNNFPLASQVKFKPKTRKPSFFMRTLEPTCILEWMINHDKALQFGDSWLKQRNPRVTWRELLIDLEAKKKMVSA